MCQMGLCVGFVALAVIKNAESLPTGRQAPCTQALQ